MIEFEHGRPEADEDHETAATVAAEKQPEPGQKSGEAQSVPAGLTSSTSRRTLPQRRECETFELTFWKLPWLVSVGYYADRVTPGEVFITGAKSGTDVESTARDGAVLLSLAIQHGVPLATIDAALTKNVDGSPGSLIGAVVKRLGGRG